MMSLGACHRVRGSITLFCSIVLQEAVGGVSEEMGCSTHLMEWQELIKALKLQRLMPRGAIRGEAIHLHYFMAKGKGGMLFNEKLRGKLCPPLTNS